MGVGPGNSVTRIEQLMKPVEELLANAARGD